MSNQYEQNPYPPQEGQGGPGPYGQQSGPDPYGQNPYAQQPPPGYGQAPAAYGQPYGVQGEHPQGTLILVFGIIGIFSGIFAPIAWYLGNKARNEIAASGAHYTNEQNINTGRMLGKVFTIIYIAIVALTIVGSILLAILAAATGGN